MVARHWKIQSNDLIGSVASYHIAVCGFEFRFQDLERLRETIAFYEQKVLPSSRLPSPEEIEEAHKMGNHYLRRDFQKFLSMERYYVQGWWERLPLYLRENGKRERVIKALKRALAEWEK